MMAFTIVVSLVANKAVTTAWKIGSGGKPPKGNQAGYIEIVTWAVASGASAAAAKRFAEDRAAKYWLKSTGSLPPGYEDNPNS
nr:DUF4235 domain-containing protein [Streptomyces sp. SID13031]